MDHANDHHGGLAYDVATLLGRRRALQLLGGVGLVALVGCSDDDATTAADGSTSTAGGTATHAPVDDHRLHAERGVRGAAGGDRPARSRATAPTARTC